MERKKLDQQEIARRKGKERVIKEGREAMAIIDVITAGSLLGGLEAALRMKDKFRYG